MKDLFDLLSGTAITFVVVALLWLSPLGRLINEFDEFRERKRNGRDCNK